MKSVRERYLNDAHFHNLVSMMVSQIEQANYTPSEMREAAVLASIIYAEHNIATMVIPKEVNMWQSDRNLAEEEAERRYPDGKLKLRLNDPSLCFVIKK